MKDNKLIAEFMGMTNHHNDKSMMVRKTSQGNEVIFIDKLEYHCSWDWLMPVVSKCFKTGDYTQYNKLYNLAIFTCDINIVHKQVVEFINEFNKN